MIEKLLRAGADAFRVNMSHGDHATHAATIAAIRAVEEKRSAARSRCCATCRGPSCASAQFKDGKAVIRHGPLHARPRSRHRATKRASACRTRTVRRARKGQRLLIDDGKLRLQGDRGRATTILCSAEVGGVISDRKGVNVPDAVVPVPALTEKDRRDLAFALDHGADWIAPVVRPAARGRGRGAQADGRLSDRADGQDRKARRG
jgi:pyruvate kinase